MAQVIQYKSRQPQQSTNKPIAVIEQLFHFIEKAFVFFLQDYTGVSIFFWRYFAQ